MFCNELIAAVVDNTGAVVVTPNPQNIRVTAVADVLVSVIEKSNVKSQPLPQYTAGNVPVPINPLRCPSATETVGQLILPVFLVRQLVVVVAICVNKPPIAVI